MQMNKISVPGFEAVYRVEDEPSGLKAFIAIHSTVLGPAVGGLRSWKYANEDAALQDALKLAEGMTYKAALAELPWGGGKAVLFGEKSASALERFGEAVEILQGKYITAKDVGINGEDLAAIKRKTPHVLGIVGSEGSSGDPSSATAWGVFHGIRSSVERGLGTKSLSGVKIAVQGLGGVAGFLIKHLVSDGARVMACDVNPQAVERIRAQYEDLVEIVSPSRITDTACDVFAPCALGGVITQEVAENLRTKLIAGAANNQLVNTAVCRALMFRSIRYAPDYVINAGGLINIYHETLPGGYNKERAYAQIGNISQTLGTIYSVASAQGMPTADVADMLATNRLAAKGG